MSLVGVSDNVNLEFGNSHKESKTVKMSNEDVGKKLKSPVQKKYKSIQNNTLNSWLTKDISNSHSSLEDTKRIKSNKVRKYSSENSNSQSSESQCCRKTGGDLNMMLKDSGNSETDVKNQKQIKEERSSSISNTVPKKNHTKIKKPQQDSSKKERSDVVQKLKDKSTSQEKSDILLTDKERVSKKKFKRIIMSPLNLKNIDNKKKYDKNASPQSNALSRWLSKHDSSSDISSCSTSFSAKEKSNKKERKENLHNTKLTETKVSNKIKSSESKLTFNEAKKEKESSVSSSDLEINSNRRRANIDKKSKKLEKFSKYSLSSEDSSISETSHITQQTEIDATPITQKSNSSSINKLPKNTKSAATSCSRKLFDVDLFSQSSSTSNVWLSKSMTSTKSSRDTNKTNTNISKRIDKKSTRYNKLDVKVNSKKEKQGDKRASSSRSIEKNERKSTGKTLDDYLKKYLKESTKRKFSRSDSSESCELPSFTNNNKKSKTNTTKDPFKKYGINIPSVEEIIKDQKDFAEYKNQIDSFKDIDDKFLDIPFTLQELKVPSPEIKKNILGCKHLSLEEIEKAFIENLDYISAIFHGKKYSERHERFFEKNVRSYSFTAKDLCYNTSTIVFNFEHVEYLITLLKKEFDPDDKWTSYFFQVLLPELCLKIFMDTHFMTHDEAVKYLDTRPIVD